MQRLRAGSSAGPRSGSLGFSLICIRQGTEPTEDRYLDQVFEIINTSEGRTIPG